MNNELSAFVSAFSAFALIASLMALASLVITIWFTYEVLRDFRGADRICWLMIVQVPVIGWIFYVALGLKERNETAAFKG